MRGEWDEGIGYYFRDLLPRDVFSVTEDCMLVDGHDFQMLGGFTKKLAPGIRGIDYCVRLFEQTSKTTLWEPYSRFTDSKRTNLNIKQEDIVAYEKSRKSLNDPFAAACFPSDYREKQRGIQYSIDSAKFVDDDAELVITGWAADFHGNEDVEISLGRCRNATLKSVERIVRLDVNAAHPVPANSILGFRATLKVLGTREALAAEKPVLDFSTSTDSLEVRIPMKSSPFLEKMSEFFRKVALLRHPRSTGMRLIEKYWAPYHQKAAYQKLIRNTEHYDLADVKKQIEGMSCKPLISLLVPVYNVDPIWLENVLSQLKTSTIRSGSCALPMIAQQNLMSAHYLKNIVMKIPGSRLFSARKTGIFPERLIPLCRLPQVNSLVCWTTMTNLLRKHFLKWLRRLIPILS